MHKKLFVKALGFRFIAIAFTAFFTGWSTSLIIHIGLFVLYYLYDWIWEVL